MQSADDPNEDGARIFSENMGYTSKRGDRTDQLYDNCLPFLLVKCMLWNMFGSFWAKESHGTRVFSGVQQNANWRQS